MLGQLKDTAMDLLKKNNPGQGDAGSSVKDGVNKFLGGSSGGGAGGGIANKLGSKLGLGGDSGGGLGGALGGLFGGGGDDGGAGKIENPFAKKESAKGTPRKLFENKKSATANLLSKEPEPPPKGTFMDEASTVGESSVFGTTHIRAWVRNEFTRREQNFGMYYTQAGEFADDAYQVMQNSSTFDASYNDTLYRGPKTAWMRVVSNSIGKHPDTEKEIYGFELHGFNDFHEIYGFDPKTGQGDGETYLGKGWDSGEKGAGEVRHTIKEEDFKHKPSPGVTEIISEDKQPGANFRETTVKFLVHSRNQLDYLDDYFFKLGSTCLIEWGWNTYPREGVLVDPTDMGKPMREVKGKKAKSSTATINNLRKADEDKGPISSGDIDETNDYRTESGTGLAGLFTDPVYASAHLKKGKGNYSFAAGTVSNYSYSIRDDGGYDCEIKVTTFSQMATGLNNESTKVKKDAPAKPDDRQKDFKLFISTKLDEILEGDDPNDFLDKITDLFTDNRANATKISAGSFARGRFYQFDQAISGKETYHSDHEDVYITVGFFIDIVNFFFAKTSEETNIPVYKFCVANSRCVAHPNIKSTDGKVLLIPNRMSPRRNGKASGSVASKALSEIKSMLSNSMDSESVIKVINSEKGKGSKLSSLDQALQSSPRDDLYDILSQRAEKGGFNDAVNPFPDFKKINDKPTQGYSGRIQDLFVNYNVIRDAVENGSDIKQIIKEIMKKVSDAAGGVWDFDLVQADTGAPCSYRVHLIDRRYPGLVTAYDIQKEDQLFRFKSHTKNSIVKNLSLDVAVPQEVAGQVLFQASRGEGQDESEDDLDNNPQATFYARGRNDRLLKACSRPVVDDAVSGNDGKKEDEEEDIESEEKFIVDGGGSDVEMVDPNKNRMVKSMKFDNNKLNCVKNNMPLDGCQISLTLDGIEGLRLLDVFTCTGVPTHYFINGHWRIQSVKHTLSDNNWLTDISGEYIPSTKTS